MLEDFSAEVRRIPESKLPLVNRSKCVDLAFEVARTLMSAQESRQLDMSVARLSMLPARRAYAFTRAIADVCGLSGVEVHRPMLARFEAFLRA